MMGKAIKYTCWAAVPILLWHLYVVKKYENPETAPVCFEPFFGWAKTLDFAAYDLHVLFTKPGMSKMLPDRPDFPGM